MADSLELGPTGNQLPPITPTKKRRKKRLKRPKAEGEIEIIENPSLTTNLTAVTNERDIETDRQTLTDFTRESYIFIS